MSRLTQHCQFAPVLHELFVNHGVIEEISTRLVLVLAARICQRGLCERGGSLRVADSALSPFDLPPTSLKRPALQESSSNDETRFSCRL